jgi:hypothetical protein
MKPPGNTKMKCCVLHGIGWNCIIGTPHETRVEMGIFHKKACPLYLDVHENIHIEVPAHFICMLKIVGPEGRHVIVGIVSCIIIEFQTRLKNSGSMEQRLGIIKRKVPKESG